MPGALRPIQRGPTQSVTTSRQGSNWESEREQLRKRYAHRPQPSAVTADSSPRVSQFELLVLDLEQSSGLLSYTGPGPGLQASDRKAPLVNVSPQYFPGAADSKANGAAAANESRYRAAEEQPPTDSHTLLGGQLLAPTRTRSESTGDTDAGVGLVSEGAALSTIAASGLRLVLVPPVGAAKFDDQDRAAAELAWRYVTANRQPQTGLINSKEGYAFVTAADMAYALAAYVAAEGLKLIDLEAFLRDTRQLLATLGQLPLYGDELFNREYDARTGRFVDLSGHISAGGSGWSAMDIGRLLVWLKIVGSRYPDLSESAAAVVRRLRMGRMVAGGRLSSVIRSDEHEESVEDARLGGESTEQR
jgi:hypothetical protein